MEQVILTTTLKQLRSAGACYDGYNKLVRSLQKLPFTREDEDLDTYIRFNHKEEINLLDILKSNGVDDCLWALRATTQYCDKVSRLIAVKCVREVQNLITDPRSLNALDVAERFANGEATEEERDAAGAAAGAAAQDAARYATLAAGWAVARAAEGAAVRGAALVVAWGEEVGVAGNAVRAAAGWAVEGAEKVAAAQAAARAAAWPELESVAQAAARDVARYATLAKQAEIIKSFLGR